MKFIIKNCKNNLLHTCTFLTIFTLSISCNTMQKSQENPIDKVLGEKFIKEKDGGESRL